MPVMPDVSDAGHRKKRDPPDGRVSVTTRHENF
jgi:hypothetical protein